MATKTNNYGDLWKSWGEFKAPGFDVNKLMTVQRRNMEAFTAANQALTQGAQQIARKSADYLRENVEQALNASREIFTTATPDTNAARQAELGRELVSNGLNQWREVSELASRTQFEAFDILNRRMAQTVEEARNLAERKAA